MRCLNAGGGVERLVVGDFAEIVVKVGGVLVRHGKTTVDEPILKIRDHLLLAVDPEQEPRP